MSVKYYYSTVPGNLEVKKNQQRIEMVLDSKKIEYEKIDIAADETAKETMRELMGDPKALPPQLFNDKKYLGDADAFDMAVEDGKLEDFLQGKL